MEFEPSSLVWKSRGNDAVIGTSVTNSKEGSKLVLITTQSEVVEYCTQSHKVVNHWTFRPGSSTSLRIGAVRNPISPTYFGLRGTKSIKQCETLVTWKHSELDVAQWKSTSLKATSSRVFGLYVHPQLPNEVLVLTENGQFKCYDDALSQVLDCGEIDDVDNTKVVWACLSTNHRNPSKGALFLSMMLQSENSYEMVIYRITPTKSDRSASALLVGRHNISTPACETTLSTCTFHAESFSYSIIWANGEWHMLHCTQVAMTGAIVVQSTKAVTTFESVKPTPVKKRKISSTKATSTSTPWVATSVGAFSYLVLASGSDPMSLVGWDSKFGVQVATTSIIPADIASSDDMKSSDRGALCSMISSIYGEVVVAAYEHAVFLLNVKHKHSTLASVLGVYANQKSTSSPAQPNRSVDWKNVIDGSLEPSKWEQTICSEDPEERQLIATLLSPKTIDKEFKKNVSSVIQEQGLENLSYRLVMAITQRCIDTPSSSTFPILQTMIETKRISARTVPNLLPMLMEQNQFELIEAAILHLTDIDERSIVRLLRYVIRLNDNKLFRQYTDTRQGKNAMIEPCERFIVALLGLPTNTVFLHHAIRTLSLSDVLLLLTTCQKYFFLPLYTNPLSEKKRKNTNNSVDSKFQQIMKTSSVLFFTPLPTMTQSITWINALIDGHVTQLVLSATTHASIRTMLVNLNTLVQHQLEDCERYENVANVLDNFLSGVQLPRSHGISDYTIEELMI